MQKDLKEIIDKHSKKLNKMIEQKVPYKELLRQSQILDEYINEYYKNKIE